MRQKIRNPHKNQIELRAGCRTKHHEFCQSRLVMAGATGRRDGQKIVGKFMSDDENRHGFTINLSHALTRPNASGIDCLASNGYTARTTCEDRCRSRTILN